MNNNIKIVDAHAHLWLQQYAEVGGKRVRQLSRGRADFLGEERQMLPPFMIDGRNSAEVFLSNMDYAQVSAAVITQEYIDGNQNAYLRDVQERYPERFICCGMCDYDRPGYLEEARRLFDRGFRALAIPAHRLPLEGSRRVWLNSGEMLDMFRLMEERDIILSITLAPGSLQVKEMEDVIAACPDLKIAIGHFGMVTEPEWQHQIMLASHDNVMIESGGITWLFNSEFYPFRGAVDAIREAALLVGMDKLMWGSDYPRTITAITYRMSYDFILKSDRLTQEEKRLFLGENARRFYGLANLIELPYIKNMSE